MFDRYIKKALSLLLALAVASLAMPVASADALSPQRCDMAQQGAHGHAMMHSGQMPSGAVAGHADTADRHAAPQSCADMESQDCVTLMHCCAVPPSDYEAVASPAAFVFERPSEMSYVGIVLPADGEPPQA